MQKWGIFKGSVKRLWEMVGYSPVYFALKLAHISRWAADINTRMQNKWEHKENKKQSGQVPSKVTTMVAS